MAKRKSKKIKENFMEESGFGAEPELKFKQQVRWKNEAQADAAKTIRQFGLTILLGPAGTAKTFIAVNQALELLIDGKVEKILIARPAVVAEEELGYLPGSVDEKLEPFIRPVYDIFDYLIGAEMLEELRRARIVEVCSFGHMRGRTFQNTFLILDEAQNASPAQLKLALTRLGINSKAVVTMDPEQCDIPLSKSAAQDQEIDRFCEREEQNIAVFEFAADDVVRSELVKSILKCYEE